ncbi:MAG TPA: hypothetical protein VLC07_00540 [Solirubrobacterales bacterium]|nr:hypothetical protein [Solirubrobacterales bacterium]
MDGFEARQNPIWSRSGAAAVLLVLGCVVGVALLAKGLYPVDLPSAKNPDFIDTIFDNRGVLWTARLLLVSAAAVLVCGGVFIVVSIGTRMKRGELLRRAGPFEVSEPTASEIEGQLAHWRTTASVKQEEVAELTECLKESDEMLERLRTAFASGSIVGKEHL